MLSETNPIALGPGLLVVRMMMRMMMMVVVEIMEIGW